MQDLMPPINTPDSAFHDGDPTTGQLGTIVTALWLNNVQSATRDVQLEIKNVLAKAGIQPDPKKTNQLAEAISQIIGSGNYASTAYVDNGLNKKIDKASISGQKGNDNDKVPSLNLFTTEIGKLAALGYSYSKIESDGRYQPKGNYAPAGDYATNAALNDGLNGKFDKAGGRTTGSISAEGNITSTAGEQAIQFGYPTGKPAIQTKINGTWWNSYLPAANGTLMQVGDFGVGISLYQSSENLNSTTLGCGFYAVPGSADNPWGSNGSAHILNVRHGGNGFQIGRTTGDMTLSFRLLQNGVFSNPSILYSSANVVVDRNGHLKRNNFPDELSDYPVGAPIPWPQATAPSGFLVCNGQSFNKITYPLLAKAYPTGVLPDLRGEFLRGLDAGRGVDVGRTFLSSQLDENKEHNHNVVLKNAVGNGTNDQPAMRTLAISVSNSTYTTEKSGGKESRPRNIAFLYIVRAA
ncbi:phage tail protein [Providencia sp. PROV077]|uniref:phage tail protein n=1 Tax=Providencia sp. PROV077 TaxID=2949799 RepID=UPI0023494510|nr:phage tail protein [Providencia sp. PROV077]